MRSDNGCDACRVTLNGWCAAGAPQKLCGLCRLMTPDEVVRYVRAWVPNRCRPTPEDAQ